MSLLETMYPKGQTVTCKSKGLHNTKNLQKLNWNGTFLKRPQQHLNSEDPVVNYHLVTTQQHCHSDDMSKNLTKQCKIWKDQVH